MEKSVAPLFGKAAPWGSLRKRRIQAKSLICRAQARTAPIPEMEEEADRCDGLVKANSVLGPSNMGLGCFR